MSWVEKEAGVILWKTQSKQSWRGKTKKKEQGDKTFFKMTQKNKVIFQAVVQHLIWFIYCVCAFVCVYKENEVKLSFNANKIYNMQWIIYVGLAHYADPLAFTERIKSTEKNKNQ